MRLNFKIVNNNVSSFYIKIYLENKEVGSLLKKRKQYIENAFVSYGESHRENLDVK